MQSGTEAQWWPVAFIMRDTGKWGRDGGGVGGAGRVSGWGIAWSLRISDSGPWRQWWADWLLVEWGIFQGL